MTDITAVIIAAPEPLATAGLYERLFDGEAVIQPGGEGEYRLSAGKTTLLFVDPARAKALYGPVAQGDNGTERMVGLEFAVTSLPRTEDHFRRALLAYQTDGQRRRLLIPSGEAFNVALVFRER
ncbi:hypothetical protein ABK905_10010 [Acerihabitans sp. KWT182]|uniref:DUF306 domain-containing protein n=1 Tax=Acerihabitans sp. KWT182 TaxID=3157919 RepID=A0AAU7QDT0_9GAMM